MAYIHDKLQEFINNINTNNKSFLNVTISFYKFKNVFLYTNRFLDIQYNPHTKSFGIHCDGFRPVFCFSYHELQKHIKNVIKNADAVFTPNNLPKFVNDTKYLNDLFETATNLLYNTKVAFFCEYDGNEDWKCQIDFDTLFRIVSYAIWATVYYGSNNFTPKEVFNILKQNIHTINDMCVLCFETEENKEEIYPIETLIHILQNHTKHTSKRCHFKVKFKKSFLEQYMVIHTPNSAICNQA